MNEFGRGSDVVAVDCDGDGSTDVYVCSMLGRCQLYRNNRDGTFADVTLAVLGKTPWGAIGANVFDAANSGRLDLFVVDMHSDMWMGLDWKHASLPIARKNEKTKFPYLYCPN